MSLPVSTAVSFKISTASPPGAKVKLHESSLVIGFGFPLFISGRADSSEAEHQIKPLKNLQSSSVLSKRRQTESLYHTSLSLGYTVLSISTCYLPESNMSEMPVKSYNTVC